MNGLEDLFDPFAAERPFALEEQVKDGALGQITRFQPQEQTVFRIDKLIVRFVLVVTSTFRPPRSFLVSLHLPVSLGLSGFERVFEPDAQQRFV